MICCDGPRNKRGMARRDRWTECGLCRSLMMKTSYLQSKLDDSELGFGSLTPSPMFCQWNKEKFTSIHSEGSATLLFLFMQACWCMLNDTTMPIWLHDTFMYYHVLSVCDYLLVACCLPFFLLRMQIWPHCFRRATLKPRSNPQLCRVSPSAAKSLYHSADAFIGSQRHLYSWLWVRLAPAETSALAPWKSKTTKCHHFMGLHGVFHGSSLVHYFMKQAAHFSKPRVVALPSPSHDLCPKSCLIAGLLKGISRWFP